MRKILVYLFFVGVFFITCLFIPQSINAATNSCTLQETALCLVTSQCEQYNKTSCGQYSCLPIPLANGLRRCTETATNPDAPLDAPKIKETGSEGKSVSLQWDRIVGAKMYQVYDANGTMVLSVSASTEPNVKATIPTTTANSEYKLRVKSCRDTKCDGPGSGSDFSNEITAKTTSESQKNLGDPCNPTLTGDGQCSRGVCVPIAASLLGVGIVDPGLLTGNVGRCTNLLGGSSTADISSVTPSIEQTGVTGNSVKITVKTTPPNGIKDIDVWNVYYRKEGSQKFQEKTVKEDNFTISGLTPNTTYRLHVFGLNKKGNSPNSNEIVITTSQSQKDTAKSCTSWDCAGTVCSRFNDSGGPVCLITSEKGQPLACSCGEAPPAPEPPCTDKDPETGLCKSLNTAIGNLQTSPTGLAKTVFGIILSLSGGLAIILIMTAGYQIMTSEGNPEKIQGAKDTITSTIIGLVFMMFSLVLLQIIGVDILRIPGLTP